MTNMPVETVLHELMHQQRPVVIQLRNGDKLKGIIVRVNTSAIYLKHIITQIVCKKSIIAVSC